MILDILRYVAPVAVLVVLACCQRPHDGCEHPGFRVLSQVSRRGVEIDADRDVADLVDRYVDAWEAASGATMAPFSLRVMPGSFETDCSPTGKAAGVAVVDEGLLVVAWPLLALPHEMTHLWLYRQGGAYGHEAFGPFWNQVIRDARAEVER